MDDRQREAMWEEYGRTRSAKLREQLIVEYAGLVKVVAGRLNLYFGHTVEYDDLVGYGIFGLIDAIDKFEVSKGVKFETYASLRIRGSILDQIRKMDWIPRSLRQKQKKLENAIKEFEAKTGRSPSNEELAGELDMSLDALNSLVNETQIAGVVSLDEYLEQGSEVKLENGNYAARFEHPEQKVERQELKKLLAEAIDTLTENERKVIAFYYYEELTLKEISRVLEVSESRVSQLHTKALKKMRERMGDDLSLFFDNI